MTQKKDKREEYLEKDRQGYDEQITNQSALLDKSILLIGTTTFNMALTFTNKLIPLRDADYICLFILSLSLMALSVVLTLLSFKFSVCSAVSALKYTDKCSSNSDTKSTYQDSRLGKWIEPMNWFSLIFLILGFLCMIIFITINL